LTQVGVDPNFAGCPVCRKEKFDWHQAKPGTVICPGDHFCSTVPLITASYVARNGFQISMVDESRFLVALERPLRHTLEVKPPVIETIAEIRIQVGLNRSTITVGQRVYGNLRPKIDDLIVIFGRILLDDLNTVKVYD
jgi:hypothetical protein